jgi:uncharacterized protein (TIGR03790 family)
VLVTALAARCASALAPQEVFVVANRASADSVALARYYAAQRGIASSHVLLLATTLGATVSRADYDRQIRDPIRRALEDGRLKDKVRCICLMWGVPLRVEAPADAPHEKAWAAVGAAQQKMHYRLAIDYKLLGAVGRDFTAPRTADLKPLGALFAPRMPVPDKPLPSISQLKDDIHKLLPDRQAQIGKITDAGHRKIAARQLLALHLDLRGLGGLIEHIRDARPSEAPRTEDIQKQLDQANRRLAQMRREKVRAESLGELFDLIEQAGGLLTAITQADQLYLQMRKVNHLVKSEAAVDSELALLWWGTYDLPGPAKNLLHWRSGASAGPSGQPPTLMTARVDGPRHADALRMMKASLATEAAGLRGVFYIDAGGPSRIAAAARSSYDARFKALERFVGTHTKFPVVLDEKPVVFRKDSCPHAALYVGWYSLRKYVPAFMWTPGAVGWHVASWEAVHLREADSQEWCPKMIQNGVAATLGAVSEPLLTQFPSPEEFFPLLLTGRYTVAECYWRTVPAASWQMTLIADPLYNPFKANPQVKPDVLPPDLAP